MGLVLPHEESIRSWPKLHQHRAKGQGLLQGICMPLSGNGCVESVYMLVKYLEMLQKTPKQLLLAQNRQSLSPSQRKRSWSLQLLQTLLDQAIID